MTKYKDKIHLDIYEESDRSNITMRLSIDRLTLSEAAPEIIFMSIAEALAAHIKENHAEELYKQISKATMDQIEERTRKYLDVHFDKILKDLDLTAITKIAAISCGKALGKEIQ